MILLTFKIPIFPLLIILFGGYKKEYQRDKRQFFKTIIAVPVFLLGIALFHWVLLSWMSEVAYSHNL